MKTMQGQRFASGMQQHTLAVARNRWRQGLLANFGHDIEAASTERGTMAMPVGDGEHEFSKELYGLSGHIICLAVANSEIDALGTLSRNWLRVGAGPILTRCSG
ncbi:hypothetical protein MX652_14115 [Thauera aromatica]|nr:hypothetical protein [Thauera aromatica]MCK2127820.1 hypothetical protein [Thauera aromatica]